MKRNIVKMSLVTAMLLSSGAFAGEIIGGGPKDTVEPLTQTSFGGWNLSNVAVKIVSTDDFTTLTGTFNPTDGTYTEMTYGDSFESDITTDGNLRAYLRGKDWPVGEPAGIKAITGDKYNKGKPGNCIMTTSYLSEKDTGTGVSGYLDTTAAAGPVPTTCSSPFQTHKRFKINMLPSMVENPDAERYGQPVDVVLNLVGGDTSSIRYQVLQKINNYTGMRLDGYKLEVLDGNGVSKVTDLNLSIGLGEGDNDNLPDNGGDGSDIWDKEDMANYSHGLWGPQTFEEPDPHFPTNGFFDSKRSGYVVDETTHGTDTLVAGPTPLDGNYVDLFGDWLPSIWQPMGIFLSDAADLAADPELLAFWGDPLKTGTNAWHQGNEANWAVVSNEQIETWLTDPSGLYNAGLIEDTLNLGLNYIVNVGNNDNIGDTFTIRITPRVAEVQTPPSYIDANGEYILPDGVEIIDGEVEVVDPGTDDTATDDTATDDTATDDTATDDTFTRTSSGGGCTYNPNSTSFDMTLLFMMALGALYPFRRRFLK